MIPVTRPELPPLEDYVSLLEKIWDSRMLSNFADMGLAFENMTHEYLGAKYVRVCTSGETGLMIALKAFDLPAGSPCYLPSFTFNSTINAALWNNLQPVFVDIDPYTYTMDPSALSRAMRRNGGNGVVVATHVFGNPCDVAALETVARNNRSYLMFDAAHGYGSHRDGVKVGNFGDAEVFSLSGTKLVTTAEGGLIATPHAWMNDRLTYLRAHGFQNDYDSKVLGLNGKFSELHAALGLLTLSKVEEAVAKRHQILNSYKQELNGLVTWQSVRPHDRSTFKDIVIGLGTASQATAVAQQLADQDIQTKRYFRPLHTMELFKRYQSEELPVTEKVFGETLCVPAYADMPEWVVGAVGDAVRAHASRSVETSL